MRRGSGVVAVSSLGSGAVCKVAAVCPSLIDICNTMYLKEDPRPIIEMTIIPYFIHHC